jgi:hypothetical protein
MVEKRLAKKIMTYRSIGRRDVGRHHKTILINFIIFNEVVNWNKIVKIYLIRLMSSLSLVNILNYTWRPFTITLASSAINTEF